MLKEIPVSYSHVLSHKCGGGKHNQSQVTAGFESQLCCRRSRDSLPCLLFSAFSSIKRGTGLLAGVSE